MVMTTTPRRTRTRTRTAGNRGKPVSQLQLLHCQHKTVEVFAPYRVHADLRWNCSDVQWRSERNSGRNRRSKFCIPESRAPVASASRRCRASSCRGPPRNPENRQQLPPTPPEQQLYRQPPTPPRRWLCASQGLKSHRKLNTRSSSSCSPFTTATTSPSRSTANSTSISSARSKPMACVFMTSETISSSVFFPPLSFSLDLSP